MDKQALVQFKIFDHDDIFNLSLNQSQDHFEYVFPRKSSVKEFWKGFINQYNLSINDSNYYWPVLCDKKSNVIIRFIRRSESLESFVGSKD